VKIALEKRPYGGDSDAQALLDTAGLKQRTMRCASNSTIFAQGAPANAVYFVRAGAVKLSVVSPSGKEAIVAMLGPMDFFGEGCLTDQNVRTAHAKALTSVTLVRIVKNEMLRALREQPAFSHRFLTHLLRRNIRIEEELVDHLFNSSEKGLARTLLLLAGYRSEHAPSPQVTLARISQSTLAEIVGTTRPRVNQFLISSANSATSNTTAVSKSIEPSAL